MPDTEDKKSSRNQPHRAAVKEPIVENSDSEPEEFRDVEVGPTVSGKELLAIFQEMSRK